MTVTDYSSVTEVPGDRITREAWQMRQMRYAWARQFTAGKDVLEVACGAGQGLGYLARGARRVVGADYTERLLDLARRHYGPGMPLVQLDAHALPFRDKSFDVTLLYEAIYYLRDPGAFVKECRRVLRVPGVLLICSVNREWAEFNPSPMSSRYLSANELQALLKAQGFDVWLYGAFPSAVTGGRAAVVSWLKRVAVGLGVVPRTMKGKEFLKRMFLGTLIPVRPEVEEADVTPPTPLEKSAHHAEYKIVLAAGHVR